MNTKMSKEQLEEIIEIETEATRHFRNNDSFNFATTMEKIYKEGHLSYLVERVQELEGELKTTKQMLNDEIQYCRELMG